MNTTSTKYCKEFVNYVSSLAAGLERPHVSPSGKNSRHILAWIMLELCELLLSVYVSLSVCRRLLGA